MSLSLFFIFVKNYISYFCVLLQSDARLALQLAPQAPEESCVLLCLAPLKPMDVSHVTNCPPYQAEA